MRDKIQIIATLGPSTLNSNFLKKSKKYLNLFRLNMSHLSLEKLEENIKFLKKNKITEICIDTEGAQIRTSKVKKKNYKKNEKIILGFEKKISNKYISLYPEFKIEILKKNTKIFIGFDGLKCVVLKQLPNKKILCKVIEQGLVENNKGVHIEQEIKLNPLTKKDIQAINLGVKYKIKKFALSFANDAKDVHYIKSLAGKNSFIISKIETRKGFINRNKIMKKSNAALIDRGDLSRYISVSKIPYAQKDIIKSGKKIKTPIYVATNLLESMVSSKSPTRAESNDIITTLESGASGLVLAAETAIGKYPFDSVLFLTDCIKNFKKIRNKNIQKNFLFS
tara:strand:- start:1324 stop:2334 length:1011 start_codon:yes stop_codon:yes gene_type:complete